MLAFYLAKTSWRTTHLVALVLACFLPTVLSPPTQAASIGYTFDITQLFLPLLGIAVMAGTLATEFEEGTAEILLSTPCPRWKLLLVRGGIAAIFSAFMCAATLGLYSMWGYLPASGYWCGLSVTVPSTLYLGSLAMVVGLVTRSTAMGWLLPSGYWLFDFFSKGRYTGQLYLFSYGDPRFNVSNALQPNFVIAWLVNKGLLFITIFLLFGLGITLLQTYHQRS